MIIKTLTASVIILGIFLSIGIIGKAYAPSTPFEWYIKFEGVNGKSQNTNCPDCMKISSWNWGTLNDKYSGNVISQLRIQNQGMPKEFNFTMVTSSVSPQLLQATLDENRDGKHLGNVIFWVFEKTFIAGDVLFKVTFNDVLITSYTISASSTDDLPMDQITISFSNATEELSTQTNIKTNTTSTTGNPEYQIPSWIKNNAGWWSKGQIDESDFVKGMQYLIQQGIMKVPKGQSETNPSNQIPSWVKNNAKWWSEGSIGDSDFVKGMQWLISNGIIKV